MFLPGHPNENDDTLVGIGVSFDDNSGYYGNVGLFNIDPTWTNALKDNLSRWSWIGHNAKYDYVVMVRFGYHPGPIAGDGMLGLYLLGKREAKLKDAVQERYDYKMVTYDELSLSGKLKISEIDLAKVFDYNLDDCIWGRQLALDVESELSEKALKVYHTLDLPLISILGDIQIVGFQLDRGHAEKEQTKYTEELAAYDVAIRMIAEGEGFVRTPKRKVCTSCHNGKNKKKTCTDCDMTGEWFEPQPLNPSSNDQLVEFLHGHLGLPIQDLTDSKQPSISKLALLQMKDMHDVIPLLIRRRAAEKYLGYLREWLSRSKSDGRIHTILTNAWVRSGRISSRASNLTQVKLDWRDNFIGNLFAGDYAQLEVRIAAFLSRDPALMRIVNNDPSTPEGDLHGQTMHNVFGVPLEEHKMHPHIRLPSKTYMFAKLYGGGGFTVRQRLIVVALSNPELDIEVPSTREIDKGLRRIESSYPKYFKEWIPYRIYMCREEQNCWAYTAMGRGLYLPDLRSPDKQLRESAERRCISMHVQGFAADLVRMAMRRVATLEHGKMILQVHDEIVSEVDPGWETWYTERARVLMELDQPLPGVPLVVDTDMSTDWKGAHK